MWDSSIKQIEGGRSAKSKASGTDANKRISNNTNQLSIDEKAIRLNIDEIVDSRRKEHSGRKEYSRRVKTNQLNSRKCSFKTPTR